MIGARRRAITAESATAPAVTATLSRRWRIERPPASATSSSVSRTASRMLSADMATSDQQTDAATLGSDGARASRTSPSAAATGAQFLNERGPPSRTALNCPSPAAIRRRQPSDVCCAGPPRP